MSKEELWDALKFVKAFKAPELDGFRPFFFKHFWNVLGDNVWRLIGEAFHSGKFDERLAETLIVLIP